MFICKSFVSRWKIFLFIKWFSLYTNPEQIFVFGKFNFGFNQLAEKITWKKDKIQFHSTPKNYFNLKFFFLSFFLSFLLLFVFLLLCFSMSLCVYLFLSVSLGLSVFSVWISVYLFVCLPAYVFIFLCLSVALLVSYVHLSTFLFVFLSVCYFVSFIVYSVFATGSVWYFFSVCLFIFLCLSLSNCPVHLLLYLSLHVCLICNFVCVQSFFAILFLPCPYYVSLFYCIVVGWAF